MLERFIKAQLYGFVLGLPFLWALQELLDLSWFTAPKDYVLAGFVVGMLAFFNSHGAERRE